MMYYEELCSRANIVGVRHNEALIGHIVRLISENERRGGTQLALVLGPTLAAIEQNQVKLYFDRFGKAVAFVIWAMLDDQHRGNLLREGKLPVTPQSISSGAHLCVLDFNAEQGYCLAILDDLRDRVFREITELTYFRIKNGRRIFKLISRNSNSTFFKKSTY